MQTSDASRNTVPGGGLLPLTRGISRPPAPDPPAIRRAHLERVDADIHVALRGVERIRIVARFAEACVSDPDTHGILPPSGPALARP